MNWWTIRSWWHRPQMMRGAAGCEFQPLWYFYRGWKNKPLRAVWRFLKWNGSALRWRLLYWQPLRCNGEKGGWRTDVCEWMELRARTADAKKYGEDE